MTLNDTMTSNDTNIKKGHTYMQWILTLLANGATLSYGFEVGWMSPTTKLLQSDRSPTGYALSDSNVAWVASILNLAGVFGVLAFRYIADRFGRKRALILLAFPQLLSWMIKIISPTGVTLVIARVFGGLAAGGVFLVVPIYVKEISEDGIRGTLVALLTVTQYIGVVIIYALGGYLEYNTVVYSVIGVPILMTILLIRAPESPAFLVKQGQINKAVETVAFLRGLQKDDIIVQNEVEAMKKTDLFYKSLPEISIITILKDKRWRKGVTLISIAFTFRSWNGSLSVLTYALSVLLSTGVKFDISPQLQTLSLPCIMIISALLLTVIVDRFERKRLLCGAHLITALSMLTLGVATLLQRMGKDIPSWLPVVVMIVALAMFSGGVSPLPYIMVTEMFTFEVRAKVMGAVIGYGWFSVFIITFIHPLITNQFGSSNTFLLYGAINLLGAMFALIFLPETRGKSETEIQEELMCTVKTVSEDQV